MDVGGWLKGLGLG
jgi:class 3 adenylate cyclase